MKYIPSLLFVGALVVGPFAAWNGNQIVVRACMIAAVIAVVWAWLATRPAKRR